jgi:hypothetical protein
MRGVSLTLLLLLCCHAGRRNIPGDLGVPGGFLSQWISSCVPKQAVDRIGMQFAESIGHFVLLLSTAAPLRQGSRVCGGPC